MAGSILSRRRCACDQYINEEKKVGQKNGKLRVLSACGLTLSICLCSTVNAEHIDLRNGDRITGSITSIWDNDLIIEPSYADAMVIDIAEIASIDAPRDFEIEFVDGNKAVVQFQGAARNGQQVLLIDGQSKDVDLVDIAELAEPESNFDFTSRADVNAGLNKGNTDSRNFRVVGNTTWRLGDHRYIGDAILAREQLNSVTTKEQVLLQFDYNWLFGDAIFFGANGSYERDPIRSLDNRYIVGAGLGYDAWDDSWRVLNMQIGLGYQTENIDDNREQNSIAYWRMRASHDYMGGDLVFFHDNRITTNLAGRNNTVFKSNTGLRFLITDLLYVNFQIAYDYETHPAVDAKNEDLAILVGFGLEY